MKEISSDAIRMLEMKIGKPTVESWFNSVKIKEADGICTVLFPSQFVQTWVNSNYADDLNSVIKSTYSTQEVLFEVYKDKEINSIHISRLSDYSLPIDSSMVFNNFVVGESNLNAYTSAERIGSISNQLYIYADSGHGKTHLLHAIGNKFLQNGKTVCYLSAEQYMFLFIQSIKKQEMIKFKTSLREVDLLLIDDFQFIQGKDSTQDELLYNLIYLLSNNKTCVLAGDRVLHELQLDSRLKSRFASGLMFKIDYPSPDLKKQILNQKAKQYKKNIPEDVIDCIVENVQGSVRELEGAFIRLCAQIEFFGETVTIHNAKMILGDILSTNNKSKTITVKDILSEVQAFYKCDLSVPSRERKVIKAKQVCMFLCRKLRNMSLPSIAKVCGVKDHTNVLYSIKQIEKKLASESEFVRELGVIVNTLQNLIS